MAMSLSRTDAVSPSSNQKLAQLCAELCNQHACSLSPLFGNLHNPGCGSVAMYSTLLQCYLCHCGNQVSTPSIKYTHDFVDQSFTVNLHTHYGYVHTVGTEYTEEKMLPTQCKSPPLLYSVVADSITTMSIVRIAECSLLTCKLQAFAAA